MLGLMPWAGLHAQQTATTTFIVTTTVQAVCAVSATDLNFGNYTSAAGPCWARRGATDLHAGTTYNIALNGGTGGGSIYGGRQMASGANKLNYQLYRDAARANIWGNTIGTDTVPGRRHRRRARVTPCTARFPAPRPFRPATTRTPSPSPSPSEETAMLRTVGLWVLLVFFSSALAGGFAVVPLRADLGKNRTSSLTVTNTEEAKTFEVRAVSWKQKNRDDTYEQERRPAARAGDLPAGKGRIAGGAHPAQPEAGRRRARLPRSSSTKFPPAKEVRANSLKTVVSMAIPVFVAPAAGPVAKGQAELKASLAKNVINIELRNTGKANLKLREWVLSSGQGGRSAEGAFRGLRAVRQYDDGEATR